MLKTYPSGKKFADEAAITAAKSVNLIDFLQATYPGEITFNRSKGRWCRSDDHSVEIFSDRRKINLKEYQSFCKWTDGGVTGTGDNINYLRDFHGMGFIDAVEALLQYGKFDDGALNERRAERIAQTAEQPTQEKEPEEAPAPARDETYINHIYNYLCEERKLSKKLVKMAIKQGVVYPAVCGSKKEWCNVVFYNPESKFWAARGIVATPQGWTYNRASGGNGYWVFRTGTEPVERVFITEAPIDALSLCELLNMPDNVAFVAMCGLKVESAKKAIADYPGATVYISTDWDKQGIQFYYRHFKEAGYLYYHCKRQMLGWTKDWNDILKYIRSGGIID